MVRNGGWGKYSARVRACIGIMIRRGIIVKEGHPRIPIYRWAVTSTPTANLYKSIANEIVTLERAANVRSRMRKEQQKASENTEQPKESATGLCDYADQALWDELKRRGYAIEDGRLVMTKKTYLE